MMGIVYSEANALGSGHVEPQDGGLTMFGRQAVRRRRPTRHGHRYLALQQQDSTEHHRGQRKAGLLHPRRDPRYVRPALAYKPDEVLKACAEKGGVIGMIAAPNTSVALKTVANNSWKA